MAGAFESLGTNFESAIAGYAEDMSSALIGSLSPIISTCVILYFTLKGYLYMSGRAEGAISDTVITAFKIALISSIALNTGNFVAYGIGFIDGVEELLLGALPSSTPITSIWSSVDELWSNVQSGIAAIFNLMSEIDFGFGNIGKAFSGQYIGTFLKGDLFLILALLFFGAVGIVKTLPKNEYSDIEHGSSDWATGEKYMTLSKNKGILLAEKHYLPVDKRGNVNVLVVGRFWFW